MARRRSISSINDEIDKIQKDLNNLREKEKKKEEKLYELKNLKYEYEAKHLIETHLQNGKNLQDLINLLKD